MERHWSPAWRARNFAVYAGTERRQQFRHGRRLRRNPDVYEERPHGEVHGGSSEAHAQIRDVGYHKRHRDTKAWRLDIKYAFNSAARPLCLCVFVVTSL